MKNRKIQKMMYNNSMIHPTMVVMMAENLPKKLQIKKTKKNQIIVMLMAMAMNIIRQIQ